MTRQKKTPKPTGTRVDPAAVVARAYRDFPKTMERLRQAEIDEDAKNNR